MSRIFVSLSCFFLYVHILYKRIYICTYIYVHCIIITRVSGRAMIAFANVIDVVCVCTCVLYIRACMCIYVCIGYVYVPSYIYYIVRLLLVFLDGPYSPSLTSLMWCV